MTSIVLQYSTAGPTVERQGWLKIAMMKKFVDQCSGLYIQR